MAKYETLKLVDALKVNKKTGIQQTQRVEIPFGAIIENPHEDRDFLRFTYLGEMYDVRYADIKGSYKLIGGPESEPAPVPKAEPAAKAEAAPAGPSLKFEPLKSNMVAARAKVPGGWLVAVGHGVAFVADANHQWDGTSL
ncbi:MAG: hypothetical protein FJW30_26055 [Acidobacteria bacterium]|nr:hypothetical protein [Acidobacteriota bacterium]